ncbi:MAG: hypothetical protein R3174_08725, partial [Gammaproteobacteria bacterium]|nr:hypothetical protein [Gammaproteobacteria bacterium]
MSEANCADLPSLPNRLIQGIAPKGAPTGYAVGGRRRSVASRWIDKGSTPNTLVASRITHHASRITHHASRITRF